MRYQINSAIMSSAKPTLDFTSGEWNRNRATRPDPLKTQPQVIPQPIKVIDVEAVEVPDGNVEPKTEKLVPMWVMLLGVAFLPLLLLFMVYKALRWAEQSS